ncbi:exonuclease domain-containing protein [Adhaeribacter aquaticus]|uniref:exonuclease domain-containing protein n=1 Tax=Adhaeribacter aquaticus TaxID=299567 RepID=UPI000425CC0D|nr:exonuclease domain-containing protein [Adhaeribacter aquaticus]
MRYVSIDLETTGTDPDRHQIIEFGAVIENTHKNLELENLPRFKRVVKHPEYIGMAFALNMNARIFQELVQPTGSTQVCAANELAEQFKDFLVNNGFDAEEKGYVRITAAGKNFGTFDLQFLNKLTNWLDHIRISHKILDPTMYYINYQEDEALPSLEECKKRAGFEDATVTHDALDDALDVVRLLRQQYQ